MIVINYLIVFDRETKHQQMWSASQLVQIRIILSVSRVTLVCPGGLGRKSVKVDVISIHTGQPIQKIFAFFFFNGGVVGV